MGSAAEASPGLSLPRDVFAKVSPKPFLEAHLQRPNAIRPNGRELNEARALSCNLGSLSHSNGSAVLRSGDTAIVCGVRAEVLLASDVPHPPSELANKDDRLAQLGLLVPNLELSTGCSAANLPGNPPGTLAQSLSYRIFSLLQTSKMIDLDDLSIKYLEPAAETEDADDGPEITIKAYWTLYIDILCIALDGNAFDTAWAAVVAALHDTRIPKARWDPDLESIICSPAASDAHRLSLRSLPMAATMHIFTTASHRKQAQDAKTWMLADADAFEEEVCSGSLTVVTNDRDEAASLLRVERSGAQVPGNHLIAECIAIASRRRRALQAFLSAG